MKRRPWTEGVLGIAFLIVFDVLALFDCFALAYLCRFRWGLFLPPLEGAAPPGEYIKAWCLAAYVCLLLFHAYGLYDQRRARDPIEVIAPLLKAGGCALLLILSLSYFYRDFTYSRVTVIYACAFGVLLLGMFRTAWQAYSNRVRGLEEFRKPVLLVGSRTIPKFLKARITEDGSYGFRIMAVADDGLIATEDFAGLPTGGLDDIPRLIDESRAEEVLIGHPALGHHQLLAILETCENRGVRVSMVPATYDLLVDRTDIQEVAGIPLVCINERRQRRGYRAVKRAFDAVTASVLLALTAPLLVVTAIGIRVDSRGPAIYRQRRVGRGGRPFEILKFRTMVLEAEEMLPALVDVDALSEPVFKVENDPRVTRVGRWLRRFSIDELPQLLNVVRGEMSLVGPRPEEERLVERYDIWERRRLKLTPGITGLQQLFCRGSRSLKERVRWDILYLRKESFFLDLWILFRTIGVVFRGKGNL